MRGEHASPVASHCAADDGLRYVPALSVGREVARCVDGLRDVRMGRVPEQEGIMKDRPYTASPEVEAAIRMPTKPLRSERIIVRQRHPLHAWALRVWYRLTGRAQ